MARQRMALAIRYFSSSISTLLTNVAAEQFKAAANLNSMVIVG